MGQEREREKKNIVFILKKFVFMLLKKVVYRHAINKNVNIFHCLEFCLVASADRVHITSNEKEGKRGVKENPENWQSHTQGQGLQLM